MKTLYLDCPSGIAGDMTLAALLDLGADFGWVREQIARVAPPGLDLSVERVMRNGQSALYLVVTPPDEEPPLVHWVDLRKHLAEASLDDRVKRDSLAVFSALAEAEAEAHGVPTDQVHFHEVGAWDSIADIVGVAAALASLCIERIETSAIPVGSGFAEMAHGRLPLPAPATARLLVGLPVVGTDVPFELTTPTGAALVRALAAGHGPLPSMRVVRVGWGAGSRELPDRPNVLRAWLGETSDQARQGLCLLETNLDDASPEWLAHALDEALGAGAVDGWFTPIQMKKNRPGVLLSVLCGEEQVPAMRELLFRETTALGIRERPVARTVLERHWVTVRLPEGEVRIKVAEYRGRRVNAAPEFADLRSLARESGSSVKELYARALAALDEGGSHED